MPNKRKYFIASDLHLEFRQGQEKEYWNAFPTYPQVKVCICAGDLTAFGLPSGLALKHYVDLCNRFDKVIYVPGNHEYYGSNPDEVNFKIKEFEKYLHPVLKVLRAGEPFVYGDQRFIGDTMWFPDRPELHMYRRMIADSFQIKDLFPWCFTQSSLFLNYLRSILKEDDIVISHHIPVDYIHSQWRGSKTQAYFVNRDSDLYFQNPNTVKPKAWIYGHTHDKQHYHVGRTEFICNPVGYPGENKQLPESAEPAIYEI